MSRIIQGQLVDLHQRIIYPAELKIEAGRIQHIRAISSAPAVFLLPGFVDAHVHIESSMLAPSEFAPLALSHGTLATVSDPHEIANVLGEDGVRWMVENGKEAPLHFHFGAPSCVPATIFETAGDEVDTSAIRRLLSDKTCHYLAEMMNWPGVIFQNPVVMEKLKLSKELGVPIDGHAPGLRGEQASAYFSAGIQTDHECFTLEEAMEKAAMGIKILIREGSAARNFEALVDLFRHYPSQVMFCSDDKHPDDLLLGHINALAARALARGFDLFDVLRAACIHPVEHYGIPLGLLREGDPADFIVVESLQNMLVMETWRKGDRVFERGGSCWKPSPIGNLPNRFHAHFPPSEAYQVKSNRPERTRVRVIEAIEGQLITKENQVELEVLQGSIQADPGRDVLYLSVVNRYSESAPANAFISGFGLKHAAIASSVAHDSHNIVAVGSDRERLKEAVDAVMEAGGGISIAGKDGCRVLPLPIAGLMSAEKGENVASLYEGLTLEARKHGSKPKAPYMLLSFMALLVIPELKLSDLGLFDGLRFEFRNLEV